MKIDKLYLFDFMHSMSNKTKIQVPDVDRGNMDPQNILGMVLEIV